jgi:chromosome segregation ATPase
MQLASLNGDLADLRSRHDSAVTEKTAAERRFRDASSALEDARARVADLTATSERLASREAELEAALSDATTDRVAVEQQLTDVVTSHQQARQRWEVEREQAESEHAQKVRSVTTRLSDLQEQHDLALEQITSLEQQFTDAVLAHENAQQESQSQLTAAADTLARREEELGTALAQEIEARIVVENTLSDADRARQHAEAEHAQAVEFLVTQLADLQAQHDRALDEIASVGRQLTDAVSAHENARQESQSQLTAAAEQLARREEELGTALAQEIDSRLGVERRLADAEAGHQQAQQQSTADLALAATRHAALEHRLNVEIDTVGSLTARLAELEAQHDQTLEELASVERRLTDAVSAHAHAQEESQSRLTAAAETLARREEELGTALAAEIDARLALDNRLSDADRTHQQAEADHAQTVDSLTTRLADLQAQYDGAREEIASIERQLTDAASAHEHAQQASQSQLAAAAEQLARREDELVKALTEEIDERLAVENKLSNVDRARQRAETERESLTNQLADLQAHYDRALEQLASVERQFSDAVAAHEHAQQLAGTNLDAAAAREEDLEDRLARAATAHATLEERLAAAEIARHDADERYASELVTLQQRLADLQGQHEATVTARGRDIARLQEDGRGLRRQLNAMRMHASSLRQEAERAGRLQLQLVETQKDIRRQFERAPYGLFECNPDGSISRVNNVLARLLGYRGSADLPREDFVATVFESAADLQWLLERAKPKENVQPIETTLMTRERRRLVVRLHALTHSGSMLIAVEDLTKLSTLEQRVREAQRMEAVGRVASEVAVTCDTLLRDVTRGGQRWLSGFADDPSQRQQGEQLLGDVTRAAGLLRQFAVFGQTQITNVEPVSMVRVLRDMKPVIERILGDDVELTLPKTTQAFEVDVDAARVERILVNAANYARERMPQGGRVRIQLATTVVDQQFLARHPKVRSGSHVLITISEMQGASRPTLPIQWPTAGTADGRVELSTKEKPGIDLGPLMALVSGLGGHLWMSVEPAGNMTLQIRLPQRAQDLVMEPVASGAPATRGRQLGKWFRH